MTTSESKGRFFLQTNRFESIRITNRIESIRIANWNALPARRLHVARSHAYGSVLDGGGHLRHVDHVRVASPSELVERRRHLLPACRLPADPCRIRLRISTAGMSMHAHLYDSQNSSNVASCCLSLASSWRQCAAARSCAGSWTISWTVRCCPLMGQFKFAVVHRPIDHQLQVRRRSVAGRLELEVVRRQLDHHLDEAPARTCR